MKIGIAEIIVICVIALVVLGPEKLPIYAKKLGASLKEVKKVTGDLSKDIRENIVEPLDEASAPLKEAIEPIVSLKEDVNKSIDDVTKSFKTIGKPAKKEEAKPEVIEAGMQRLGIMGFSYCVSAFMDCTIAASRGIGKSFIPTVIVVLGSCVFRVISGRIIRLKVRAPVSRE